MSKDYQSYELIERGVDYDRENDHSDQRPLNPQEPLSDQKLPHSNTTTAFIEGPDADETPNVPLERKFKPLLFSFALHLIPSLITIAIVQLSIFNIYWFDNDSESDMIPWSKVKISLNELLNLLQFAAKLHEILLVGSLGAMVMHRVRVRLLGKHGLPFGMLVGGYSVGAPEYLLSSAFRSGFNKRFWPLSLLIFVFTLLSNTLGPCTAIALVPNLDWWDMRRPFGSENLPVVFSLAQDQWWPLEVMKEHAVASTDGVKQPEELCFSTTALTTKKCPASGFDDLLTWVDSNANEAIAANVTITDGLSPVQRRLKSRLTDRHDTIPGVAITTSLSHPIITVLGTFWEQVRSREYPVNEVIRPQLGLAQDNISRQPIVQVQCLPVPLEDIHQLAEDRKGTVGDNYGINTFSTKNASRLQVPDWLYDLKYSPPTKVFLDQLGREDTPRHETVNLTWLERPSNNEFNLSIAAVVTTPMVFGTIGDPDNSTQSAFFHFCSVDARWIGSAPTYDPTEHLVLASNISDPLVFAKPNNADDNKYHLDMAKWGVSPAIRISQDWANALNVPAEIQNITAQSFQWLLGQYVYPYSNGTSTTSEVQNSSDQQIAYIFNPGNKGVQDSSFNSQIDINNYAMSASETVATLLGLQITDGLARIHLSEIQTGIMITDEHVNDTHVTASFLEGGIAGLSANSGFNISNQEIASAEKARYTFEIQRYGYGYGFRTATVYFGIAVLLSHTLLTIIYIVYALYDYFWVSHWTSSAWGDIGEFAALLINSQPTVELQNTCSGVDSKRTWMKRLRIRETGKRHLGIVVGDEGYLNSQPVRIGESYGMLTLEGNLEGRELRRRRGSI